MLVDTSDLACMYCNETPVARAYEVEGPYKGEWHLCKSTGQMTRFLNKGHKKDHKDNRPEKFKPPKNDEPQSPLVSYMETFDTYDQTLGGPTRGRR
jgi:hypothetical protein